MCVHVCVFLSVERAFIIYILLYILCDLFTYMFDLLDDDDRIGNIHNVIVDFHFITRFERDRESFSTQKKKNKSRVVEALN